jgi:hypothetical protein
VKAGIAERFLLCRRWKTTLFNLLSGDPKIIHRNIKAANILVDYNCYVYSVKNNTEWYYYAFLLISCCGVNCFYTGCRFQGWPCQARM